MITFGVLGVLCVVGFVVWVVFREPWVASRGDPAGPYAQHHAEQERRRRSLVTSRALDRLRDARDVSDTALRAHANGSAIHQ